MNYPVFFACHRFFTVHRYTTLTQFSSYDSNIEERFFPFWRNSNSTNCFRGGTKTSTSGQKTRSRNKTNTSEKTKGIVLDYFFHIGKILIECSVTWPTQLNGSKKVYLSDFEMGSPFGSKILRWPEIRRNFSYQTILTEKWPTSEIKARDLEHLTSRDTYLLLLGSYVPGIVRFKGSL